MYKISGKIPTSPVAKNQNHKTKEEKKDTHAKKKKGDFPTVLSCPVYNDHVCKVYKYKNVSFVIP
jgi:hypothetical protein